MTDEELSQYIVRYGDRLALRAFCRQRTVTNEESGGVETVKSSLMQKLRDRLRTPANSDTQGPGIGNKHAAKVTRRVEMGWLHFESGTYHQVRTRKGGGTRNLSVQKSVTMGELVETGKGLFFPNEHSSKGPMEDFESRWASCTNRLNYECCASTQPPRLKTLYSSQMNHRTSSQHIRGQ